MSGLSLEADVFVARLPASETLARVVPDRPLGGPFDLVSRVSKVGYGGL